MPTCQLCSSTRALRNGLLSEVKQERLEPFSYGVERVVRLLSKQNRAAYSDEERQRNYFDCEPVIILLGARACRGLHGYRLRRRCWDRARGTERIRISPEPGWSRRCAGPRRHGAAAL